MSRIESEYDIEKLPGYKDIWKILSMEDISENKDLDSEVTTKDFHKREKKKKTIVIKRK